MSRLKRRGRVNTDIEKDILIGLITSTSFCRDCLPLIDFDFFQLDYVKKVIDWVGDYYSEFDEAPFQNMEGLYKTKKKELNSSDKELIENILQNLSEDFETSDRVLNKDFLLKRSIQYFNERSLINLSEKINDGVSSGRIEIAEKALTKHQRIEKELSGWFDPFDKNEVLNAFEDRSENILFSFPGALGKLLGPQERGWLVSFMGPPKRGKTLWLKEIGITAALRGFKVADISLEMSKTQTKLRTYRRVTGRADKIYSGYIDFPVFDCRENQEGTCNKTIRKNDTDLDQFTEPDKEGNYIYAKNSDYKPCTECRGKAAFVPAVWYETKYVKEIKRTPTFKDIQKFKYFSKKNIRSKVYPAFSANLSDVKRDLDKLFRTENFNPDVIIIDYADILAPEYRINDTREQINITWKTLKRMAAENNCLVVTASQMNRKSINKKNMEQVDTAENIMKLAHVDAAYSINQTREEKRRGISRIGVMIHRHLDFDEFRHVMVLQQMKAGQALLDSEWYYS